MGHYLFFDEGGDIRFGAVGNLGVSVVGEDLNLGFASGTKVAVGKERPLLVVDNFGLGVKLSGGCAQTGNCFGRGERKVVGVARECGVAFGDDVVGHFDDVGGKEAGRVLVVPSAELEVGAALARVVVAAFGAGGHFLR